MLHTRQTKPIKHGFTTQANPCILFLVRQDLLLTGTLGEPAAVVAELKTIPQIRSTQTAGVPVCVGELELVAHGMVIQSVVQVVPTTEPAAGLPPVMLKAMEGVFTVMMRGREGFEDHDEFEGFVVVVILG